jgi:hypothetical protein
MLVKGVDQSTPVNDANDIDIGLAQIRTGLTKHFHSFNHHSYRRQLRPLIFNRSNKLN